MIPDLTNLAIIMAAASGPITMAVFKLIPQRVESVKNEDVGKGMQINIPAHDHNGRYVSRREWEIKNEAMYDTLERLESRQKDIWTGIDNINTYLRDNKT